MSALASRSTKLLAASLILISFGLLRCGASSSDSGAGAPSGSGGAGAYAGAGGMATGGAGNYGGAAGAADAAPPPPEKEVESSFRSPVATGKFVWTANPSSGRVALIDATTYEVKIADAGFGPTYIAAIPDPKNPDSNEAIVLNVLSH